VAVTCRLLLHPWVPTAAAAAYRCCHQSTRWQHVLDTVALSHVASAATFLLRFSMRLSFTRARTPPPTQCATSFSCTPPPLPPQIRLQAAGKQAARAARQRSRWTSVGVKKRRGGARMVLHWTHTWRHASCHHRCSRCVSHSECQRYHGAARWRFSRCALYPCLMRSLVLVRVALCLVRTLKSGGHVSSRLCLLWACLSCSQLS
jgi:hypothetical protein